MSSAVLCVDVVMNNTNTLLPPTFQNIRIRVTSDMICAGDGGKSRKSGCHGDSGGPFVCKVSQSRDRSFYDKSTDIILLQ